MSIRGAINRFSIGLEELCCALPQSRYRRDMSFTEAASRFPDRNGLYAYVNHYFYHLLPEPLRAHRRYFSHDQRGFGESAFHAMWWLLLREFQPRTCLEIGVYRGQVISLWTLVAKTLDFPCEVHGISPFAPIGDSVSTYRKDVDYLTDTLGSFNALELQTPTLVRTLSTDRTAVEHIASREWDLIYIDGSHDFDVVLADYRICRDYLKAEGLLVMDDASLGTSFRPPGFSFAGHPGPSRVASEFAMKELVFVGAVGHNNVFRKAKTKLLIG